MKWKQDKSYANLKTLRPTICFTLNLTNCFFAFITFTLGDKFLEYRITPEEWEDFNFFSSSSFSLNFQFELLV